MPKWLSGLIDSNEKELKRLQPTVKRINELEPEYERLSNDELRAKTREFKQGLQSGITLDELLPEAFAASVVAESEAAMLTAFVPLIVMFGMSLLVAGIVSLFVRPLLFLWFPVAVFEELPALES